MSKDLNKVQFTGRLGKDPETRHTPQGSPITKFTVAANTRVWPGDGQAYDEVEWFNVVAWNKLADICAQYIKKGSRVYITGRLQTHSWEDQNTGQKRYMTEVIANDMIMLDSRRDGMGGAPAYEEADVGFQDTEMEAPARQYGQGSAPRPQQASRPANDAAPAQRAAPASSSPRRPVAPQADEDDLPF